MNRIFGNDSVSLFRGSAMGDLPEDVLAKEKGKATVESDSIVEYDYTFKLQSGKTRIHLFYTFDEFGLFEIQTDFYPESEASAEDLMPILIAELTEKFGNPKQTGVILRWTTVSKSNSLIEITLSNETPDAGEPFVSLNYLEPLPDEL